MADTFEDLGIMPELVAGAQDVGWDAPSTLQKDAVPVLRRGNNAILHASSGAGVTGAWGLAILDRVASFDEDEAAPLALVLAPSTDEASRTASALAHLGAPAGVSVRALAPGWAARPAPLLVATPTAALAGVRDSSLKLDAVSILVISGADRMQELGEWDAVRTLTESMTAAAQKIVVTGTGSDRAVQEYAEGHLRKALTIPARPAEGESTDTAGSIRYAVATDDEKLDALVAMLPEADGVEVAVVCRTQARAERISEGLAARGIDVEGSAAAGGTDQKGPRILVLPATEADQRSTRASVISCDPPFDSGTLMALHGTGGTVLPTPSELPHLKRIAARAGVRLQGHALPRPGGEDAAEAARNAIRSALGEADLAAYLSLLQPLLDEHPAAEVAAAALYLARTSGGLRKAEGGSVGTSSAGGGSSARTASGSPAPAPAFVRLFVTAGSRDDVTPGDLVGAITGEAGVEGETVGRIDIRESHSTVEVASTDAARVINALNGRTLKGRSLRVDYDRKDRAAGQGGAGGADRDAPRSGAGPRSGPKSGGPRTGGGGRGGPKPGGPRTGGGGRGGPKSGGRGGPARGGGPSRGGGRGGSPRGTRGGPEGGGKGRDR